MKFIAHAGLSLLGSVQVEAEQLPSGEYEVNCVPLASDSISLANSSMVVPQGETTVKDVPPEMQPAIYYAVYQLLLAFARDQLVKRYVPEGATAETTDLAPPTPAAKA